MTDMGKAFLVLEMKTKRDREAGTLIVSQEAYCKLILERFGMSDCKPTSRPELPPPLSRFVRSSCLIKI